MSKPKTYNHAFALAFEISGSTDEEGNELISSDFKKALLKRMETLDSAGELEWQEAVGAPYDTYEE